MKYQSPKIIHISKALLCINCDHIFEGSLNKQCPVCASRSVQLVNNWLVQASGIVNDQFRRV
ncbi:MAG: hypothetical protein GY714_10600 [Desulfobacterales bacterium]|nr:hypothetical protein [Desulfobacterales bacterium]